MVQVSPDSVCLRDLIVQDADQIRRIFGSSTLLPILEKQLCVNGEHEFGVTTTTRVWGVFLHPDPGNLVGIANYHHYDNENHRTEIGGFIAKDYRRQGIMRQAVEKLTKLCFERFNIHRIEATVEPDNKPAIGLVESCGFKREGDLLRERIHVDGSYRNVIMYSLLSTDDVSIVT